MSFSEPSMARPAPINCQKVWRYASDRLGFSKRERRRTHIHEPESERRVQHDINDMCGDYVSWSNSRFKRRPRYVADELLQHSVSDIFDRRPRHAYGQGQRVKFALEQYGLDNIHRISLQLKGCLFVLER